MIAADDAAEGTRRLSIGFVLPYGEPRDGFFPDTFLGSLCAVARAAGHRGEVVRVYYDGRDADADRAVAERLERWLDDRAVDLVVVERLFDPAPIRAHTGRADGRACVLVTRADSVDPMPGVDLAIGLDRRRTRGRRRSQTVAELGATFARLLVALAAGEGAERVPGVTALGAGARAAVPATGEGTPELPLPVLEQGVIAPREPPPVIRKTIFGNAGCPYAADPADNPVYAGVTLGGEEPLSRGGCAFCCMGGDYQKRPDAEVVSSLVAQAAHVTADPAIEELVLSDQYPIRYLAALLDAAHAAGVRPVRWLFAARCDAFLRDTGRIAAAAAVAQRTGHVIELYLSGFESFWDADLRRYNKGVTVADQLEAIEAMRALAARFPGAFVFDRARGHSLILWNPWTTAASLQGSVRTMREHGLSGLFDDVGRNRLRLYEDLPITRLAERDGALLGRWEDGDEGAGRRKGYNPERPWRFLDPGGRDAHDLALGLRERLGTTTEMSQLAAVADHWAEGDALAAGGVLAEVEALEADLLAACAPDRRSPARGRQQRAAAVSLSGACNNGCAGCANRDVWSSDDAEAAVERVREARRTGRPVLLAGREPTLHRAFIDLVRVARGSDERAVGVVTNGRRFAYRSFCVTALEAGLSAVSLKLFGTAAATADGYTRVPGGFVQAVKGARQLKRAGLATLEIRMLLHRDLLPEAARIPAVARHLGASQLRVEVALDAVGLSRIAETRAALAAIIRQCASLELPLEVSPLAAGTARFDWMPGPRNP